MFKEEKKCVNCKRYIEWNGSYYCEEELEEYMSSTGFDCLSQINEETIACMNYKETEDD